MQPMQKEIVKKIEAYEGMDPANVSVADLIAYQLRLTTLVSRYNAKNPELRPVRIMFCGSGGLIVHLEYQYLKVSLERVNGRLDWPDSRDVLQDWYNDYELAA